MEKLLLIDGSNLLFQMFYGMPSRIVSSRGKPVHGTVGFVGALLKIIRMVEPTHIAVLFDGECQNERKTLDSDYKANRPDYSEVPEDEVPFSQLPDIYAALDELGISYAETADCEADDWIAGYALGYAKSLPVVIASQDSDFFQLIAEHVQILRYRGDKTVICDENWLYDKLGIHPQQYAAFKALTGDSADNIPGVSKIGPKTAAALLRQFGDLETMLQNTQLITRPSIRQAVENERERLQMNHRLILLQGGAQLPFEFESLECQIGSVTSTEILKRIHVF